MLIIICYIKVYYVYIMLMTTLESEYIDLVKQKNM